MFTNRVVEEERKRYKVYLGIGLLLIVFACFCFYYGGVKANSAEDGAVDLHSLIVSDDSKKTDKMAYIDVSYVPYVFAIRDDITDAYYFVMDDDYMYVAYMSEYDFDMLNKEDINENKVKIQGITRAVPKEIRELAVDSYNEAMEDEANKITLAEFEDYFGSVYLDITTDDISKSDFFFLMFILLGIAGISLIIASIVMKTRFTKNINKLTMDEIMKIDNEINDKDAFYYKKAHLYLTKNYIVNFDRTFNVIKYDDIIWVYPYTIRTNGFKTSQSIVVVNKEAKRFNVASLDIITKQKKEMYDEIFNVIVSKNSSMIVGYDRESRKKADALIKDIKSRR